MYPQLVSSLAKLSGMVVLGRLCACRVHRMIHTDAAVAGTDIQKTGTSPMLPGFVLMQIR
jgi:hypothetical protein